MNTFATDDEIKIAHDLLLPGKPEFDDDKVAVIKSNFSQDIKACPGSGKTTVLLAKLLILANRMPFADGSGICVLTHTNVAIDEIKARFGSRADILFSYPNFCGTIQSFVDKFLSIPWFNSYAPTPVVSIDDDRANSIITKAYMSIDWKTRQVINYLFKENDKYQKACKGKDWEGTEKIKLDFIKNTYVSFKDGKFYRKYGDERALASFNPKSSSQSQTYKFINLIRCAAIREGVLKYNDAYSIALKYSQDVPELRDSISQRFKYLFIY